MSDIYTPPLSNIWNKEIITQKDFPNNLKLADVTLVFKKESPLLLENYRPISALLVVSKTYEKVTRRF